MTRIAFGTMALTNVYNPGADLGEAADALVSALDAGVRVLHTARHYGDGAAYRMVREIAGRHPSAPEQQIIVKIDGAPARLRSGAEGVCTARDELGRDGLDAQLVESWPGQPEHSSLEDVLDDLESGGPRQEMLAALRADGTVRRVGIEAYGTAHVRRAVLCPGIDFVVCDMSAIRQVVPAHDVPAPIADGRVELVAIRPLAGGWLTDRYATLDDFAADDNRRDWYALAEQYRPRVAELFAAYGIDLLQGSLRFLHSLPYVGTIVVGTRTAGQVRAALDPAAARPLPDELVAELVACYPQPVVIELD